MGDHAAYKFSIQVTTQDIAVLHCLRALADLSEKGTQKKIAWGGTGEKQWRRAGNSVTFHFSSPDYRTAFLDVASRLLGGTWQAGQASDSDPATPVR